MQAVQLTQYQRSHPKIELRQVATPQLGDDDLLIRVKAAGVNPLDNLIAHGELKLVVPYSLPQTMGNEFVGIVEQVGINVSQFQVGDRVYARNPLDNIGAFAEEVVINQSAVAQTPAYLSDQEAASVPLTALTAMQALELLDAQPGQTLFISGGTGSFGAMAIPLAVAQGLKVITSGSERHRERVEQLGVSEFFDYKKENYQDQLSNVDLVIDTLGGTELEKQMTILRPQGKLVSLRAMPNKEFAQRMRMGKLKQLLFGMAAHKIEKMAAQHHVHYDFLFVEANGQQLAEASKILEQNAIHPAVGQQFPLGEAEKAMQAVQNGHQKGKVIINL